MSTTDTVLDWVAAILVLFGSLFACTAAIGVVRFPDAIARMHPGTKTQVLGLIAVLIGAGIRLRGSVDIGMLVLAGLFTVIVSPVFAHLVGRAVFRENRMRATLIARSARDPDPAPADDPTAQGSSADDETPGSGPE